MERGRKNRKGVYVPSASEVFSLRCDIRESEARTRNPVTKGPRVMAIYEYVNYKGADGKKATHQEKMEHVANYLRENGYSGSTIENAKKWIADFVNGITNEFGQTIKKSGGQQGDDDAR